ncbi:Alpha/Beta hydrolase protein [Mycena olivaceomarginata]|nr:Alpha/Beta hydrolase protein [Mycena olivaceomarginata]
MSFRLQLTGIFLVTALIFSALAQEAPIVDLGYARYQGTVTAVNITQFLGIRYAASPLNDLRFRAPQPPSKVAGVQQATVPPNQCFQTSKGLSSTNPLEVRDIIETEDCLFLNVYYPSDGAGTPAKGLPVIIFIHGGGYLAGHASATDGADLINQSNRGLVVVIIQYRLGLFGFLSSEKVKQDGDLNVGLLDQDFALRWTNKHISRFGGDPSKVTIWGQSAGAGSVLQHIVANDGRTEPQLFRAAMTSSTFLPSQYHYNDPIRELTFSKIVEQSNCTFATHAMACLRSTDADSLQAINIAINNGAFFGTYTLVPVVDGSYITQRPTLSLLQGKVNGGALLSVTNTFEGVKFVDQTTADTANATVYALELFPDFGPPQADKVGAFYAGLGTQLFQETALMGESIFICPTYLLLRAFGARAFKGEFAIPPGLHADDLPYYFPSSSTTPPPFNNPTFIDAFAQTFTSFAIALDPNVKVDPTTITPPWQRWEVEHTEMLFNKTADGLPVVRPFRTDDALLARCQFWASQGALTAQ